MSSRVHGRASVRASQRPAALTLTQKATEAHMPML